MKRVIWLFLFLPLSLSAQIARTGTPCSAASTSCTPTAATGVLQIAYAGRNGSSGSTAPTVPAGWTSMGTGSINGTSSADSSAVMACRVTTSTNQASGTFTNAGTLIIVSYSGFKPVSTGTCETDSTGTPSFFTSTVNTTTTTETFNAITSGNPSSWILSAGYAPQATGGIGIAPTGMTNITSQGTIAGIHDTNATASSFSSANVTLTTAGRIITATVEIKAAQVVAPTCTPGAGTYTSTQSVTCSSSTSGSTTYCTIDGSTPTTGSLSCTSISVASSTTLKAISAKTGMVTSSESDVAYSISSGPVWESWNGATVGSSAGNISSWSGTSIGTSTGNIKSWNGVASPGSSTYSTSFSATENPISDGGKWINGLADGTNWANMQTGSSTAYGTIVNYATSHFDDSTAILTGNWGWNQTAQDTTVIANSGDAATQEEVELRLNSTIISGENYGYEFLCSAISSNKYCSIVRWNGALDDWTTLAGPDTTIYTVNGDVLKATNVNGVLTLFQNGTSILTATDYTFTGGSPGIGAWQVGGTTAELPHHAVTAYSATPKLAAGTGTWALSHLYSFDSSGAGTGGSSCASSGTSCTVNTGTLAAGHVFAVCYLSAATSSYLTSVSSTGGSGETWSLAPRAKFTNATAGSSSCALAVTSNGGETAVTCNASSTANGYQECSLFDLTYSGSSWGYDDAAGSTSASCTACTGPAAGGVGVTMQGGNDAVVVMGIPGDVFSAINSPYSSNAQFYTGSAVAVALNVSSYTQPSITENSAGLSVIVAMALKGN